MRQPLLTIIATAAGLGACAPLPGNPYGYGYGYAPAPAYYDGAYAPGPVYAEPGYAPYATPGAAIIIGGERRFDGGDRRYDGGDRYRYERQRNEGAYRGNPNERQERNAPPRQAQQNFGGGGGRPGPSPVAASRPGPGPGPQAVPAPPAGGAAFEQWNRTHVNASGGSENQSR